MSSYEIRFDDGREPWVYSNLQKAKRAFNELLDKATDAEALPIEDKPEDEPLEYLKAKLDGVATTLVIL